MDNLVNTLRELLDALTSKGNIPIMFTHNTQLSSAHIAFKLDTNELSFKIGTLSHQSLLDFSNSLDKEEFSNGLYEALPVTGVQGAYSLCNSNINSPTNGERYFYRRLHRVLDEITDNPNLVRSVERDDAIVSHELELIKKDVDKFLLIAYSNLLMSISEKVGISLPEIEAELLPVILDAIPNMKNGMEDRLKLTVDFLKENTCISV